MTKRRFGLLRLSILAFATILITGCQKKIQLPPDYGLQGSRNPLPVIELQNDDLIGKSDKQVISSTTAADPETVTVTADSSKALNQLARIQLIANATDNILGIRYFRVQVTKNQYTVLYDITAQQFVDDNNMVYPSLGIIGSDNNGNAGVNSPLEIWPTGGGDVITVTTVALNFGFGLKKMVVNYVCPKCWIPQGGGGPFPTGGVSGGGGSSCSPRTQGPFVEVNPNFTAVGSTLTSPDSSWSATIQAANPVNSAHPYAAILKSGVKTYPVPFTIGSVNSLLQPMGGVGFSANSSKAVIATYNDPTNVATQVSFQIADKSKVFGTSPSSTLPSISVYEKDPVAVTATPEFVQPRIFFSPDGTLALVLSAPVGGTNASKIWLSAFDLKNGFSATQLANGGNTSSEYASALVSGCKIQVTLANPSATLSFNIP